MELNAYAAFNCVERSSVLPGYGLPCNNRSLQHPLWLLEELALPHNDLQVDDVSVLAHAFFFFCVHIRWGWRLSLLGMHVLYSRDIRAA